MQPSNRIANRQHKSTKLTAVDSGQLALPMAQPVAVTKELIFAQPSFTKALELAMFASGRSDKEIYSALGIDKGQWSRILDGQNNFPQDKYFDFCAFVGNRIIIEWLADGVQCYLEPKLSSMEVENISLRARVAELEHDAKVEKGAIIEFVKETRL